MKKSSRKLVAAIACRNNGSRLYGKPLQNLDVIKKITFGDLIAHQPSLFENKKYDVLKFDVKYSNKGDNLLHRCNKLLKNHPFTTDFPDYHPHMTIGYIKPGKGYKYVRKIGQIDYKLTPQYAVYSQPDGTKTKIEINVK